MRSGHARSTKEGPPAQEGFGESSHLWGRLQLSHQDHLLEGKEQSPVLPPLCTNRTPTTGGTSSFLPWALPSQSSAESQMPGRNWELLVKEAQWKCGRHGKPLNTGLSLEPATPHSILTLWSPPDPPLKCPSPFFSILTQPHLNPILEHWNRKAHPVCSGPVSSTHHCRHVPI